MTKKLVFRILLCAIAVGFVAVVILKESDIPQPHPNDVIRIDIFSMSGFKMLSSSDPLLNSSIVDLCYTNPSRMSYFMWKEGEKQAPDYSIHIITTTQEYNLNIYNVCLIDRDRKCVWRTPHARQLESLISSSRSN